MDILCRSCPWTWYVFPIVPPPPIQLSETQKCSVHGPRCWSMTTHDFPSWHWQVRSAYSWVGTVLKTGLCFPTHPSKPQWKRQTRNLFTPSGSSSRFSREAAHLAVLLGFWWLLLELPSPSWMSAKQSVDCVCDPWILSFKNICIPSPLWLTDSKLGARIYSRRLTQWTHTSPDIKQPYEGGATIPSIVQMRKTEAQSNEETCHFLTLPLHPSPDPQVSPSQAPGLNRDSFPIILSVL